MQLTARLHAPNWRPFDSYEFREEARAYWERIWQSANGDLAELVRAAEAMGKPDPATWVQELHRFLFYVYPGELWLLRYPQDGMPKEAQSKKTFLTYLRDLAEEHEQSPYPREWYTQRNCTHGQFVQYLRMDHADDKAAEGSVVAELDAHVPWLGTHLREVFDLMRHPALKGDVESIRLNLERLAHRVHAFTERRR